MSLIIAFLRATAFSYLAAFCYQLLGKPSLISKTSSKLLMDLAFYLAMFCALLYVSYNPTIIVLTAGLGVLYAFATVASFIGYGQIWMAYWKDDPEKGSDAGQVGMAFWDLVISISLFYLAFR